MGNGPIPPMPGMAPAPVSPNAGMAGAVPAQANLPAMDMLEDVHNIVRSSRAIANKFPATIGVVDDILSLVQELQVLMMQSAVPQEPQLPPGI